MRDGFDCSELMDFAERLGAQPKEMLKAQKKMLRTSGTKLRRKTAQRARADVRRTAVHRPKYDRKAGDYHRSIKRGKLNKEDDTLRIRVYSSDKIGHLIEDGWTPELRDGSKGSYQAGKKVFDKAAEEFEPEFESAAEDILRRAAMYRPLSALPHRSFTTAARRCRSLNCMRHLALPTRTTLFGR